MDVNDVFSPASMHHASVFQTWLYTSGSVCDVTLPFVLRSFLFFSVANSHLGIPAWSERLYTKPEQASACVCVRMFVCVPTLCLTLRTAKRFQSLCSWSVMKSSFLFNSSIDQRVGVSQEQVEHGDGNITTALPHFSLCSQWLHGSNRWARSKSCSLNLTFLSWDQGCWSALIPHHKNLTLGGWGDTKEDGC